MHLVVLRRYALELIAIMAGTVICFWADTSCFGICAARLTEKMRHLGFKSFVSRLLRERDLRDTPRHTHPSDSCRS